MESDIEKAADALRVARRCRSEKQGCEFCELDGREVGDDPGCRYLAKAVLAALH